MKICFAGDLAIDQNNDVTKLFDDKLGILFHTSDVVCINLEGPFSGSNGNKIIKKGPHLSNNISVLKLFDYYKINLVTIANNHIMDYGKEGLRYTIDKLDSFNISHIGAGTTKDQIYKFKSYVIDGSTKLAIINIAQKEFGCSSRGNKPGYAWFDSEYTDTMIKKAVSECKYVIVVGHMGAEDWCIPLPEVRKVYRHYVDMGVNMVVGHHTHTIQGVEKYNDGIIYYSLGDLAFDGHEGVEGLVLELNIDTDRILDKVYQIKYVNNQVRIENNVDLFSERSKFLLEENNNEYEIMVDKKAISDYLDFERYYYGLASGIDYNSPISIQKFIKHRRDGDAPKWDDVFLYHNIAGEQHRWVCIRAIEAMGILYEE